MARPAWGGLGWEEARQLAMAFLAGFQSSETRRGYRSDLAPLVRTCATGSGLTHDLHPLREIRRIHLELYLRQLETNAPRRANVTLYRRISMLSSWFRWLEDEEFNVSNPAARMRRPTRHPTPQPWLDRNRLTDLLSAAEDEGGDAYAVTCLLGLNGLRVSEACYADVT
ncbi:MAG: hypothetical protein M3N52_08165, partial [Actinomycetota bacterium]|nr:hypothetical protein [Actinomycetota bacterium]